MANATGTARKAGAKGGAKASPQKKKTRKKAAKPADETPTPVEEFIGEAEAPAAEVKERPWAGTGILAGPPLAAGFFRTRTDSNSCRLQRR